VRYHKSKAFQFLLFTVLSYGALSPFSDQHVIAASWQLTWADNSSNETGFRIERKTGAAGMFSVITTTGPNVTSYNDSTLSDSTMYCYRVNAFNGAGSSPYTPEVCGTTPASPPTTYSLTVSAQGSGTVTSSPSGVNCGTTCVAGFTSGAVITLQALAATGYTFAGWGGDADCSDGSLTMNANKTCIATFTANPVARTSYTLAVNAVGTITAAASGSGKIVSSPAGIDCGSKCSAAFQSGTIVSLQAVPAAGSTFTGWSGDADCLDGTVTMTASKSCTATFIRNTVQTSTLTVNVVGTVTTVGTGKGSVTSNPAGINCGISCSANFTNGTNVTLTATPASGSVFSGWSGDADCSDGTVTMTASKSCTATFTVKGNRLHIVLKGKGKGRVTGSPGSIDCVTDCSANFTAPTRVVLRAIPALGSAFTGWSGDPGCSNGVVATINSVSCIANFEQRPSSIGIFNTTTHEWHLKSSIASANNGCNIDPCTNPWQKKKIATRGSQWIPLVGDWNGSGTDDLGIYSPSATNHTENRWYLDRNGNGKWNHCDRDQCIRSFGQRGDLPVVGDWSGRGKDKIGVFRPSTGEWFLDLRGNGKFDGCSVDRCIASFGQNGDLPVTGDWDASGISKIGLFRPSTGEWFLDVNGNGIWDGCNIDQCIASFGQPEDLAVAGDWDATGSSKIGLFRPATGEWFLDVNGNGQWDGASVDKHISGFGQAGDSPVAGKW
jgi:hypothetical protein